MLFAVLNLPSPFITVPLMVKPKLANAVVALLITFKVPIAATACGILSMNFPIDSLLRSINCANLIALSAALFITLLNNVKASVLENSKFRNPTLSVTDLKACLVGSTILSTELLKIMKKGIEPSIA